MTVPTPLFKTTLTKPLTSGRLTGADVVASARVIDPMKADAADPRLEGSTSLLGFHAVTYPEQGRLLVEWPDATLAWAFVPFGPPVVDAIAAALQEAYTRGRAQLETIHLQHLAPAGEA